MLLNDHDSNIIFKLDARLPITRGNLKVIAMAHVMSAYNIAHISKDAVGDLLKDMKYIYPPLPNVCDVYSYNSYCSLLSRARV